VKTSHTPYIRDESKVTYQSKNGKEDKTFDALEWLAAMPACVYYFYLD